MVIYFSHKKRKNHFLLMAILSCKEKVMELITLEKHGFGQLFLE